MDLYLASLSNLPSIMKGAVCRITASSADVTLGLYISEFPFFRARTDQWQYGLRNHLTYS